MAASSELKRAEALLRAAWIVAVISAFTTLSFAVIAAQSGADFEGFNILNLIDSALLFFLAFVVYRQSRAGAVALVAYWLFDLVTVKLLEKPGVQLILPLIFGYLYAMGAKAAFDRKRILSFPQTESSGAGI